MVGKQEGFCVLVDFIAHIEYELLGQYCFLKGDKVVYFLDKSLIEHHLYRRKWIIIIRKLLFLYLETNKKIVKFVLSSERTDENIKIFVFYRLSLYVNFSITGFYVNLLGATFIRNF